MMESCSSDELSSDEEVSLHSVIQTGTEDIEVYLVLQLQSEFAKGRLKPGLLSRAAPPKTYTNNVVSKTREEVSEGYGYCSERHSRSQRANF